jgi:uroporphyrinogen-III synthase
MPSQNPLILLTRPAALNAEFARLIQDAGIVADIVSSPVTEIAPLAIDTDVSQYDGAIFTSRNGVENAPVGRGIAWCVGEKTAQDARAKGWQARSAGGDANALFQRICADFAEMPDPPKLVHYCGEDTRGRLAERLSDVGISTDGIVVYRQMSVKLSAEVIQAILDSNNVILPVFSPASAQRLVRQIPQGVELTFVAISQATAEVLPPQITKRIAIATSPNAQSLITALRHVIQGEKASQ